MVNRVSIRYFTVITLALRFYRGSNRFIGYSVRIMTHQHKPFMQQHGKIINHSSVNIHVLFSDDKKTIILVSTQNVDYGYLLEPLF